MMKTVIKLTEERLGDIVSLVLERMGDYADEDYLEAFLITFRQWITEKLGDESKKYPLSFLLNKYGGQFEKAIGVTGGYPEYEEDEGYSSYRLKRVAKELVDKGKYLLPSLNSDVKFTEKYAKVLSHFIDRLELPDYVTVEFIEDTPNMVKMKVSVDFPTMIKQDKYKNISPSSIDYKLRKDLESFAGVEFGNPVYGEVNLTHDKLIFKGLDEWVKNVLNKKIKKDIKALVPNLIHGIRFEPYGGQVILKVAFKDSGWSRRSEALKKIREYLQSEGYHPDVLKVES